jgi:hypothetical protein
MKLPKKTALYFIVMQLVMVMCKPFIQLIDLLKSETKLAVISLIKMIALVMSMLFLSTLTWVLLLFSLFYYLISLHYTYWCALLILAAINFCIIILLYFILKKIKNNSFFSLSREQFANLTHRNTKKKT